jgi:serine/threonine kinase 16
MVRLFKGTCEAVRAMHDYRAPAGAQNSSSETNHNSSRQPPAEDSGRHSDDDERFPQPEGDGDNGYSYGSASMPLVSKRRVEEDSDVVFDENMGNSHQEDGDPVNKVHVPYAHRDLKPGQVFL